MSQFLAMLHDLPKLLEMWAAAMGAWVYVVIFAIIFAETGLIVTPFLPGDSLLFALGALTAVTAANGEAVLNFGVLVVSLIIAANCGDLTNYSVGRWLGLRLFKNERSKLFNPRHLARTQAFYEKHGGKTIMIARFLPIIRTYAPFVAGLGRMPFRRFAGFSVAGGAFWIIAVLGVGRFFGNIPAVKSRFEYIVFGIIVISLVPAAVEFLRSRRADVSLVTKQESK